MKFLSALVLFFIVASSAHSNQSEICAIVDGAKIIAQDNENTYLGNSGINLQFLVVNIATILQIALILQLRQ
jgi:hypothetical protein